MLDAVPAGYTVTPCPDDGVTAGSRAAPAGYTVTPGYTGFCDMQLVGLVLPEMALLNMGYKRLTFYRSLSSACRLNLVNH